MSASETQSILVRLVSISGVRSPQPLRRLLSSGLRMNTSVSKPPPAFSVTGVELPTETSGLVVGCPKLGFLMVCTEQAIVSAASESISQALATALSTTPSTSG